MCYLATLPLMRRPRFLGGRLTGFSGSALRKPAARALSLARCQKLARCLGLMAESLSCSLNFHSSTMSNKSSSSKFIACLQGVANQRGLEITIQPIDRFILEFFQGPSHVPVVPTDQIVYPETSGDSNMNG